MVACDSARGSSATLSREGPSPSAADRPTLWNLERRTIERETRYLYAYSMKLLRDPDLAQDAVQETLLAGLQYADKFEGRSSLRTWLTTILRHKIVDLLRSRTKGALFFEEPEAAGGDEDEAIDTGENEALRDLPESGKDTPADEVERKQFWATLQGCLSRIPARNAEIFVWRVIRGESTGEIVSRTGISPSNCHTILSRTKSRLRVCLTNCWLNPTRPLQRQRLPGIDRHLVFHKDAQTS